MTVDKFIDSPLEVGLGFAVAGLFALAVWLLMRWLVQRSDRRSP